MSKNQNSVSKLSLREQALKDRESFLRFSEEEKINLLRDFSARADQVRYEDTRILLVR